MLGGEKAPPPYFIISDKVCTESYFTMDTVTVDIVSESAFSRKLSPFSTHVNENSAMQISCTCPPIATLKQKKIMHVATLKHH